MFVQICRSWYWLSGIFICAGLLRQKKTTVYIPFFVLVWGRETVKLLFLLCTAEKVFNENSYIWCTSNDAPPIQSECIWSINLLFLLFWHLDTLSIFVGFILCAWWNVCLQPDAKKEPGHKLQFQWIFFFLFSSFLQYQQPSSVPLTCNLRNIFGVSFMKMFCASASLHFILRLSLEFIDFMAKIFCCKVGRVLPFKASKK